MTSQTPQIDWAFHTAREAAMALPPSDFGSSRAIAAVAALLRAERAAGQGEWQPIETAPKDGTIILISGPRASSKFVEAAYWGLAPRSFGGDKHFPWTTLDETNGTNGRAEDSPTHWMPMPAPPAASHTA